MTANGSARAEVGVGDEVRFDAVAEVPPGAGYLVSIDWDFDGSGTYFVTALVHSRRDGDVAAPHRRIPNLASARVVVS